MIIFGSGTIVEQLAREELIDEYMIVVTPVILGAGRPLFGSPTGSTLNFWKPEHSLQKMSCYIMNWRVGGMPLGVPWGEHLSQHDVSRTVCLDMDREAAN